MTTKKLLLTLLTTALPFFLAPQLQAQQGLFIANEGQWNEQARYRIEMPMSYAFLEGRAITYKLYHPGFFGEKHAHHRDEQARAQNMPSPRKIDGQVLRAVFLDAHEPVLRGERQSATHFNFFMGKDRSRWRGRVPAYGAVRYRDLYPGVDLHYYQKYGTLKYDLIVAPQADPNQIRLKYEGHEGIELHQGRLRVYTQFNYLEEQTPVAYQVVQGEKVEVPAAFVLDGDTVSFRFPEGYDSDRELVIDPEIVFSTYSGSSQDNWAFTATYDNDGHTYTAGITRADGSFPTTPGAFQEDIPPEANPDVSPATTDVAVQKFNADGTALLYSTYLGGGYTDVPHSLIVNGDNELIVMGTTSSPDFPTTDNAYERNFKGGTGQALPDGSELQNFMGFSYDRGSDIFISVFSPEGASLRGSTFLGGSDNDGLDLSGLTSLTRNYGDFFRGNLAIDEDGSIIVAGITQSNDFPTTGNSFQRNLGGPQDAVISSLSPDVSLLQWSTFFGGNGFEGAFSVQQTPKGDWAFCGGTDSNNLPVAGNPINPNYQGNTDGYVAVISSDGRQLLNSTYIGTGNYDQTYLMDLDTDGNILVFGQTTGQYPVSGDNLFSNENSGQFLHKLTPDLSATVFSTVFGSTNSSGEAIVPNIRPTAFLVSECGSIYLSGWGGSTNAGFIGGNTRDMPVKVDETPVIAKTDTDGSDFYLMQLSADATSLRYAAYLGGDSESDGDHVDGGTSRFDKQGNIYHAACVCRNNDFPSTPEVFSESNMSNGFCNNLAFKYRLDVINAQVNPTAPDPETGELVETTQGCPPLAITFTPEGIAGDNLIWDFGDGTTAQQGAPGAITHTFTEPGTYTVTQESIEPASCEQAVSDARTSEVFPADFSINPDESVCQGEEVQLLATGGNSYEWVDPNGTLNAIDIPNPTAEANQNSGTTTYEVRIENEFGCRDTLQTSLTVFPGSVELDSQWVEYCVEFPDVVLSAESFEDNALSWTLDGESYTPDPSNGFTFSPGENGSYEFIAQYESNEGCVFSDTMVVEIPEDFVGLAYLDAEVSDGGTICQGDSIALSVDPGFEYQWSPEATLSASDVPNVQASPVESTTYTVRIFGGKEGCFVDREIPVEVIPEIIPVIDYEFEYECGELVRVKLSNETEAAQNQRWEWDGKAFSQEAQPGFFQPDNAGIHTLSLVASTRQCVVVEQVEVEIPDAVRPPNVITPNNDGKNDTFVVAGLEGWRLQIFDRWGTPVFETTNYQNDWAGEGGTGNSYYYLITAPDGTQCKGIIHVLGKQ